MQRTEEDAARQRVINDAGIAASGWWMQPSQRERGWDAMLAEFLAALLVWGGGGFLLDRWLGTDPWLMILGLMVGNAAGLYLLWLRSNPQAQEGPTAPQRLGEDVRGG